jgi:adenine-specific DNA-methyltransferase
MKFNEVDGKLVPSQQLTNIWEDIAWEGIANEGKVELKKGKKPEKLLQRIIEMSTEKNDIVLDYHLGSGTTCAVAHKMGRQYIGIEQLDYRENDSVVRLQNVINGEQGGISKSVNWQGGGDFIYFELAKWNETAKEKILECESLEKLEKFFDEMYERYFLNYNLKIKEFKEKVLKEDNFRKLSLDEQKKIFVAMLDNNQMYVNKTEMADKKFGISEEDQNLTNQFYNSEK